MSAFVRSRWPEATRSTKRSVEEALGSRARRQFGLISRNDALAVGLTVDQIKERTGSARWVAIRPGVYLINGTPPSFEQAVMAACLSAGDGVVASHATAASVWGVDGLDPSDAIHVTGPLPRHCRLDGVVGHRSGRLEPADVSRTNGVPVTSPARTLIDIAGLLHPLKVGSVVDDALRRGLLTLPQLRSTAERLKPAPGRSMKVIKAVLEVRLPGYSPGDSDRELWIVDVLIDAGFERPVLGHRVRIGKRTYKLDLSYPDRLIALEYDSWAFHGGRGSFDADRDRFRALQLAGWTVLQYTSASSPAQIVSDAEAAGVPKQRLFD